MTFKAKPFRTSKMSRNLSRHSGVSCDSCGKSSFPGKRYKCLTCYDFDLCTECYESGETGTSRHSIAHPMQCILTRVDSELYFGGEAQIIEAPQSFTCPICGQIGFSEIQIKDHVTKKHAESSVIQEVICPVCAAYPNGDPNHLTDDLPTHLTVEHRAMEPDSMATQSRVRRLIGRRRAGLDRYIGVLSREAGQSQDNIDPITELLTQLSGPNSGNGGGSSSVGAGSGRRPITEFPPHIQQLLEQQERQGFERGSPLRRPVYRKIVAGGGAPPVQYETPLPTFLLQGHPSADTPHLLKGSGGVGETSRGLLAEPLLRESSDRGGTKSERDSPYLLANYNLPEPTGEERAELEGERRNKSMFVQELLLSTLAYSDSSSSSSDASDHEQT